MPLFLVFVASLIAVSDAFLFSGRLNFITSWISLVLACLITAFIWQKKWPHLELNLGLKKYLPHQKPWAWVAAAPFLIGFWYLLQHPILESVRSPFELLSPKLFLVALVGFLLALKWRQLTIIALLFYLGTLAFAYPLGFGFDPLLHRAAASAIQQTGAIEPTPILYGGYYSLVVTLSNTAAIPLDTVDRFLVPGLAALVLGSFLPFSVIIFLPLALLTLGTPFSLGVLLFFALILFARRSPNQALIVSPLLALAATLVHPLAGLPALLALALQTIPHVISSRLRCFAARRGEISVLVAIIGALLIPTMLFLRTGMPPLQFSTERWLELIPTINLETSYRPFQDLAYLLGAAIALLYAAALIQGIKQNSDDRHILALKENSLLFAVALTAAALALQLFEVPEVIGYEQTDFGSRLLLLAILATVPIAAKIIEEKILHVFRDREKLVYGVGIVLLTIMATSHWYLLYPRRDRHEVNRGFNASKYDFEAARIVESDAADRPYVLLSPQTVAAAFVRELGFPKKSIYPIPTGGAVYPYFLQMSSEPSNQVIDEVRAQTKLDQIYFVLPSYWWNSKNVVSDAEIFATQTWNLANKVFIFKYLP